MTASIDQNTVNNINAANATAIGANASNVDASVQTLGQNFNTFLTLLTAQLQNQDPLSPMDSNQFTQQLVQFSQVEQQIQTNDQLKQLISAYQTSASSTALTYLGRDAIITSSDTTLSNGTANWAYDFDTAPSDVTLSVKDAQGHIVYSKTGEATAGDHLFSWDGTETNGNTAPDGVYTLVVTAQDSSGNALDATVTTRETILGVDFTSSSPEVITASGSHGLDDVRAILSNTSS